MSSDVIKKSNAPLTFLDIQEFSWAQHTTSAAARSFRKIWTLHLPAQQCHFGLKFSHKFMNILFKNCKVKIYLDFFRRHWSFTKHIQKNDENILIHRQSKVALNDKAARNENPIDDITEGKSSRKTLCSFRAIQTTTGATEAAVASVASAASSFCSLSEESEAKEMSRISTTSRKQAQYQFGPSPASKLHLPFVQSGL